jgi:hypothetical protein
MTTKPDDGPPPEFMAAYAVWCEACDKMAAAADPAKTYGFERESGAWRFYAVPLDEPEEEED